MPIAIRRRTRPPAMPPAMAPVFEPDFEEVLDDRLDSVRSGCSGKDWLEIYWR